MTEIRIEVKDPTGRWRRALTVEQAAARHGRTPQTMSVVLSRLGKRLDAARAGMLDGKKPLFWQRELAELMRTLPGRGANLRQ